MRKIVVVMLLLSLPAQADELMGYGSIKCRGLNGWYQKAEKLMPTIAEQWVTGYLSGLNMASQGRERDITEEGVAKLLPELKAFCVANPDKAPFEPVAKAWMAMPRIKS